MAGSGVAVLILFSSTAFAATLEEQIRQLNEEAKQSQNQASQYKSQGDTLANRLAGIKAQSASISAQLSASRAKQKKLEGDIAAAQEQLKVKKLILNENVRAIYQQSQITPLEMLASSKSFSEYVERQQYLDRIKDHVQEASNAIQRLKNNLDKQNEDLQISIRQQSDLSQALAAQQAEQGRLLAETRGEESRYAEQAKAKSAEAERLEEQQRAILAAQFGGNFGAGGGPACGGGYPAVWCNAPRDSLVDSWGMYNRECVSYTAFKVASSGRYMPYWGGKGNANQWPANARAAGIPVDGNPRPGDIAISMAGPYGHAMYVESVNGNTISISQYNAAFDGNYSTATISKSGLEFIHF